MEIKKFSDNLINNKIKEFSRLGGCVNFKIYSVHNLETNYQAHHEVAKATITEYSKFVDFDELSKSGIQIQLRDFLGPQFDLSTNKVLLKGVQKLYNHYFYYDSEETEECIINLEKKIGAFDFDDIDGVSGAFCGAFLDPPYSLKLGKGNTIFEIGKYFLDFCDLLFSDLTQIEIYKWSVNCSDYFEDGKEWWGAHFWTVYNPTKNIYIGILASTTD